MMRNVSFNQNNTALALATKLGFSLYNLSEIDTTLRETHRDTKEKLKIEQSAKAEDIFLIERHYEEPIVAVVPVTKRRRLVLWDFGKGQSFPEKDKSNEIIAVKFYKRNVIVFTEFDVMMHSVDRLTYGDHHKIFKTSSNPKGIHAVAYAAIDKTNKSDRKATTDKQIDEKKEICLVAVPYKNSAEDGLIEIFDVENWRSYGTCQLHSTPVEALAFNASGTLLTSASKSGKRGTIYSVIRVFALKTEMSSKKSSPKWSFEADEKFEFRRDYFGSASILSLSFSNCSNFIIANTSDRAVSVYSLDEDVTCRKMSKIVVKGPLFKLEEEAEEEEKETLVESTCWPNCYPVEKITQKAKDMSIFKKDKGNNKEEKVFKKICAITTINDKLRVVIVTSDLCLSVYTIPNSMDDKYTCLGYYDLSSKDPNYGPNTTPAEIIKAKLLDYTIYEATAMHDHAVHRQLEKEKEPEKKRKQKNPGSFERSIKFSDEVREISRVDVTASTSAAAAARAAAFEDAAAHEAAVHAAAERVAIAVDAAAVAIAATSLSLSASSSNQQGSERNLRAAITAAQKLEWLTKDVQNESKP